MKYPRYERVREMFAAEVNKLNALFQKEGVGELRPNQCEVTYINTIKLAEGLNPQQHLARITPLWAGHSSEQYLSDPESTTTQTKLRKWC
jgi:hypothetical protein